MNIKKGADIKMNNKTAIIALLVGVLLLIVMSTSTVLATTYYISSSLGNDSCAPEQNDENHPWRTIRRVNQHQFNPGDIIKFKRGDTWEIWFYADEPLTPSTSGNPDNRITFTSYGTGDLPIFLGSAELIDNGYQWTLSRNGFNEYYCEAAGSGSPSWWWLEPWIVEVDNEGLLWLDNVGNLKDHEWGYGDNDALGFNTIYIRDNSDAPGSPSGFQSVRAGISPCIIINNQSYIDIDGIETRNGTIGILMLNDAHHNRIMNCICTHNHDGIYAVAYENIGGYNEVHNCNCSFNYGQGICSAGQGKGLSLIRSNLCEYNNHFGMWIGQGNGSCLIEYNECRYNSQDIKETRWAFWGIEIVQNSSLDHHIVRYNKSHHNAKFSHIMDGGGINIRADNAEVYYNLCYLNEGPGIAGGRMEEPPHYGAKIYNNVLYHNCQTNPSYCAEIFLHQDISQCELRNNILYKDSFLDYYSIIVMATEGTDINNNLYYYSPLNGAYKYKFEWGSATYREIDKWQSVTTNDGDSLFEDPKFVNASNYDFHIKLDSPCINRGDGTITSLTERDYWKNIVPSPEGGKCDIGAHEFVYGDSDGDGILDDGNNSSILGDSPCTGGVIENCDDNCIGIYNPDQADSDSDGIGDVCDPCPNDPGNDLDKDGICGDLDPCPNDPGNDLDKDGICGDLDNCPTTPNGPLLGTCTKNHSILVGSPCMTNNDCGLYGFCSMHQEDTSPPYGNGIGDACECEGDFDCDGDVDGSDLRLIMIDIFRNRRFNACTNSNPCYGDFDCDQDVDAIDLIKFRYDYGRRLKRNPCPACRVGERCAY